METSTPRGTNRDRDWRRVSKVGLEGGDGLYDHPVGAKDEDDEPDDLPYDVRFEEQVRYAGRRAPFAEVNFGDAVRGGLLHDRVGVGVLFRLAVGVLLLNVRPIQFITCFTVSPSLFLFILKAKFE